MESASFGHATTHSPQDLHLSEEMNNFSLIENNPSLHENKIWVLNRFEMRILKRKIENLEICFPLTKIDNNYVAEFIDSEGNHIELTTKAIENDKNEKKFK